MLSGNAVSWFSISILASLAITLAYSIPDFAFKYASLDFIPLSALAMLEFAKTTVKPASIRRAAPTTNTYAKTAPFLLITCTFIINPLGSFMVLELQSLIPVVKLYIHDGFA